MRYDLEKLVQEAIDADRPVEGNLAVKIWEASNHIDVQAAVRFMRQDTFRLKVIH